MWNKRQPAVAARYLAPDLIEHNANLPPGLDGPFLGKAATGNKLRFSTADFFRIENGKFTEHWDVVDSLPRANALGLVPAPKSP